MPHLTLENVIALSMVSAIVCAVMLGAFLSVVRLVEDSLLRAGRRVIARKRPPVSGGSLAGNPPRTVGPAPFTE